MSKKGMFSNTIVESDAFLDMPLTAQALYFHLGMNADNDGFVNPKRVVRMAGANEDDLKILIAKRFLFIFDSGVVVIKHWWINNTRRHDRHVATTYQNELAELFLKDNKSYTKDTTQFAIPTSDVNPPATKRQPNGTPMQFNATQSNSMQSKAIQGGFKKTKIQNPNLARSYAKAVQADKQQADRAEKSRSRKPSPDTTIDLDTIFPGTK